MRNGRLMQLTAPGVGTLLLACGLAIFAGCSSNSTTKPPEELAPPTNLQVFNMNNEVDLTWTASTSAGLSDFSGYNVYRSDSSLANVNVNQWEAHRLNKGETVSTSATQFNDGHLTPEGPPADGHKYYYMVVAVKSSNQFSQPVVIDTAPRPEKDLITLAELKYVGQPSALSFEGLKALNMVFEKKDSIDVYLGTTDPADAKGQPLALKSPSKVVSENDWSSRVAGLLDISNLATGDQWKVPDNANWSDQVLLTEGTPGQVIAVRTPADADGHHHYGKIWIESYTTETGGRKISIKAAYQPIADYPRFERPR